MSTMRPSYGSMEAPQQAPPVPDAAPAAPPDPARGLRGWIWMGTVGAGVFAAFLGTLLVRSLEGPQDATTLRSDALIVLFGGILAAVCGAMGADRLRRRAGRASLPTASAVVGAATGLFLAAILAGNVYALSRATVTDGVADGAGFTFLTLLLALMGVLVAISIAVFSRQDPLGRACSVLVFVTALYAIALGGAAMYTLWNATELERAAEQRVHRNTPGLPALAALVVMAVAARLRSGRARPR